MRALLLLFVLGLGCSARAGWSLATPEFTALPGGARFFQGEAQADGRTVRIRGVLFSTKQARLAVLDNAAGAALGDTLSARGAIAGTNGAYFHPDNAPLGLMIAEGARVHAFERAKLLSGVLVVTKGRPRLVRAAQFTPSPGDTDALQAGPFLVEAGQPIAGLNAARSAPRTVIATDGRGKWALLTLSSVTLAEAADVLSSAGLGPDFDVDRALNLDGGSSTGLWVARPEGAFSAPEFTTVRNFVAVLPR